MLARKKLQNKDKVTYESAHVIAEEPEHCKLCIEIPFDLRNQLNEPSYESDDNSMPELYIPDEPFDNDSCSTTSSCDNEGVNDTEDLFNLCNIYDSITSTAHAFVDGINNILTTTWETSTNDTATSKDSLTYESYDVDEDQLYVVDEKQLNTSPFNDTEIAFPTRIRNLGTVPAYSFAHGDLANWLFDSGASSHFTPVFRDLLQPERLTPPINIRVADGSTLQATHKGIVELHFTTNMNAQMNLRLIRVLYVPGLSTRLF